MKNKLKSYLKGVWGIDIVILVILVVTLIFSYYETFNKEASYMKPSTLDALLNKEEYIKEMIYYDSKNLSEYIYNNSMDLSDISYIKYENQINSDEEYLYNDLFYIIVNKENGEFTTSDEGLFNYIYQYEGNADLIIDNTKKYVQQQGFSSIIIDNENKYNYFVKTSDGKRNYESIQKYQEIYYRNPVIYDYIIRTETLTARVMIVSTIITLILLLKIIINLIFNRENINLEFKTLRKIIYVLVYGLKYKNTRNKIIISFSGAIGVILIYLYLVAGIRNQNIMITFLSRYPFKGTLILVVVPLICVIYSLKKSLDISIINDGLKKINSGDLEFNLYDVGEREIKELVDNINQIKDGYKIALNEKIKNEKLKTELISNISHDLKTPLTSIINYVNILNGDNITEEEKKYYLTILDKNSKRLKTLIDDLFEISKLNSGKMTIEKNQIDIISFVYQSIGEYSNLYEEKNIDFKVNTNEDSLIFNLDGKLMSRVFENIIINALKYSLSNTRVYVDIIDKENSVEISFKNISNYEMDFNPNDMFERFIRADKSRNSSIEGSGIGLAIAKSIVELHNGSINVEVEGDMFKIFLIMPKE